MFVFLRFFAILILLLRTHAKGRKQLKYIFRDLCVNSKLKTQNSTLQLCRTTLNTAAPLPTSYTSYSYFLRELLYIHIL